MNWMQLIIALAPVAEEALKAIEAQKAAGKDPADIHTSIVDHLTQLPAKIRQ
jgi:hypothetical protein